MLLSGGVACKSRRRAEQSDIGSFLHGAKARRATGYLAIPAPGAALCAFPAGRLILVEGQEILNTSASS